MRLAPTQRLLLLGALSLAAGGCELAEVITPAGREVLVVEAVLRADAKPQQFLLHRSLDGRVVGGVPGAQVAVLTPGGREVRFREDTTLTCLRFGEEADTTAAAAFEVRATCYTSPEEAGPWVVPGEEYELSIETPDGRRIRGRTRLPGRFALLSPATSYVSADGVPHCTLPPGSTLPLIWSSAAGTWAYVAAMDVFGLPAAVAELGITDLPDPLRLRGLSVSESDTTMLLPTQFGIFERGQLDQELLRLLQNGFPAGVRADVVIAAYDRNLVNAVRGGAFNPSGNVRISSVVGDGVGVFGSLVPLNLSILALPGSEAVRCRAPSD